MKTTAFWTGSMLLCIFFSLMAWTPVDKNKNRETPPAGTNNVIVPAYFFPYDNAVPGKYNVGPNWSALIDAAKLYHGRLIVIANPGNGPGSGPSNSWEYQKYKQAIDSVRAQGSKVLGYVHTCYGLTSTLPQCQGRTLAKIKTDVDNWKTWYNVDGIFWDEAASAANKFKWYKDTLQAYSFTKFGAGAKNYLNYGTFPDASYYAITAYHGVIENTAAGFDANYNTYKTKTYPANATVLIHSLNSSANVATYVTKIKSLSANINSYYITEDVLPNPWDTLSKWFASLFN